MGEITSIEIDRQVRDQLTKLLNSPTDSILWIKGPVDASIPSQNTTTAAVLASIAARNGIPCVKYFNSVSSLRKDYRSQDRHEGLQDLILCLITQLVAVQPEDQIATNALLHRYLDALEARTISIDESLTLLAALRRAVPSELIVVIDHCHVLETGSEPEYSKTLYRLFRCICQMGSMPAQHATSPTNDSTRASVPQDSQPGTTAAASTSDKIKAYATKICFTTDGYMNTLAILRKKSLVEWDQYDEEADELGCEDIETFG